MSSLLTSLAVEPTTYEGSGIYILEYSHGSKLGQTRNLARRMAEYAKPWCREPMRIVALGLPVCFLSNVEWLLKKGLKSKTEFVVDMTIEDALPFLEHILAPYLPSIRLGLAPSEARLRVMAQDLKARREALYAPRAPLTKEASEWLNNYMTAAS